LPNPHGHRLVFADVRDNVMATLESNLKQADDAIVLQLLANRANQYRAHVTSTRERISEGWGKRTGNSNVSARLLYSETGHRRDSTLTGHVFCHQNDAVIASTESITDETTRTILIVDDDRSVADTFARMLKLEGFGVVTALSAETGLELADSTRPDAIILDMRMPITNGLQFLRTVRSKPHLVDVPVAIVTGDYFLAESIQHELKSLGASIRFKPLWLEDLIALAKTLVSA
jgi:CheY-like chemotaxis protein